LRIAVLIATFVLGAALTGAVAGQRGGVTPLEPPEPTDLRGELHELATRPGVTQAFILVRPPGPPAASVILFPGGDGRLGLSPRGLTAGKDNFLVRNRERFAGHGLLVAVVDTPSDHWAGLGRFRTSAKHAEDIRAVIGFLRTAAAGPVWLVGTSRGTVSAANVAARLQDGGPDGLVLTASVVRGPTENLKAVRLEDIRVPTLVVHHRADRCLATPYEGAAALLRRLEQAPRRELLAVEGGDRPRSEPCGPLSPHGFLGLDADAVSLIAAWITPAGPR
jgi:pimeloyl-ACP methyl ester carboxylesterase